MYRITIDNVEVQLQGSTSSSTKYIKELDTSIVFSNTKHRSVEIEDWQSQYSRCKTSSIIVDIAHFRLA